MNSELESLAGRVDRLLSWLQKTESQMERETMDDWRMKENEGRTLENLSQRLQQCKVK